MFPHCFPATRIFYTILPLLCGRHHLHFLFVVIELQLTFHILIYYIIFATIATQQQRYLKWSLLNSNNTLKNTRKNMSCTRSSSMRTRSQRAYLAQKAKNCNKRKEKVQLHKKKNKYTHICALSKAPQLSAVITFRLARSTAFFNSSHILFTFRTSISNHFLQQIFIFIIYCSFTVAGYLFALLLCLAYRNHLIYCNFLSSTTTTMLWIISSHNSTHSQQFYNALSSYVNSHAFNVSITVRRYLF